MPCFFQQIFARNQIWLLLHYLGIRRRLLDEPTKASFAVGKVIEKENSAALEKPLPNQPLFRGCPRYPAGDSVCPQLDLGAAYGPLDEWNTAFASGGDLRAH